MKSCRATPKTLVEFIIAILLVLPCILAHKIGCDINVYNLQNWDCDTYDYYFASENLKHTLYCIGYDHRQTPTDQDGEQSVIVNQMEMDIRKITRIDEASEKITLEGKYQIEFVDHRFNMTSCPARSFGSTDRGLFWAPVPFIPNLESVMFKQYGNSVLESPRLTIGQNGIMYYTAAAVFSLHCPLDFHAYPFDSQTCRVPFTLMEVDQKASFDWKYRQLTVENTKYPDWDIQIFEEPLNQVLQNEFFVLNIKFHRRIQGHLLHFYLPSYFLTLASTLSLFIPYHQTPARMCLSSTTSLATVTLFVGAKNSMPKTSYIKASGYWMLLCYISVFYCLIEFCIIITLTHNKNSKVALKPNHNISIRSTTEEQLPSEDNTECMTGSAADKIETISRIFIPIYSLSYTLIYFIVCFTL